MELTREEILAMPAGAKMDGLIAEKVMGLDVCIEHVSQSMFHPEYCFECRRVFSKSYSVDIAVAWEVLENLPTSFSIGRPYKTADNTYSCWFDNGGNNVHVKADTASLAICRAALLMAANV